MAEKSPKNNKHTVIQMIQLLSCATSESVYFSLFLSLFLLIDKITFETWIRLYDEYLDRIWCAAFVRSVSRRKLHFSASEFVFELVFCLHIHSIDSIRVIDIAFVVTCFRWCISIAIVFAIAFILARFQLYTLVFEFKSTFANTILCIYFEFLVFSIVFIRMWLFL